jgi:hypothetical protein
MMDDRFKIFMTKIHPDFIGMKASLTRSLVTGWVTYLDDLIHKLDMELL